MPAQQLSRGFPVFVKPNPGTVVFAGYGSGFADTRIKPQPFEFPSSFGFDGYNRTDDAFFVKASYLFRL